MAVVQTTLANFSSQWGVTNMIFFTYNLSALSETIILIFFFQILDFTQEGFLLWGQCTWF